MHNKKEEENIPVSVPIQKTLYCSAPVMFIETDKAKKKHKASLTLTPGMDRHTDTFIIRSVLWIRTRKDPKT
jgi:hypothetical protein